MQTETAKPGGFSRLTAFWQRLAARLPVLQPSTEHLTVFVLAFSMLFLESTLFSTLLFTHTYLVAIQSIAFALLGTGLGSIAGHYLSRKNDERFTPLAFLGSLFSVIAVFLNIALLPKTVMYSPVMVLPFFFGSAVISATISRGDEGSVYFYDLVGAGCGIVTFVILLPILGEEGDFIFLALGLATARQLLFPSSHNARRNLKLLQYLLAGLLVVNVGSSLILGSGVVNLAALTRCYSHKFPTKVFCRLNADPARNRVLVSRGDLAARIDVVSIYNQSAGHSRIWVENNGITADKITSSPVSHSVNDLRVPHVLADQPDVLIIGTAGEGIIKPARLLAGDEGRLDGIEINAGLAGLMRHRLRRASGGVYDNLDSLTISDARTYLNTHTQKYGLITLLNSFTGRMEDLVGAPEYLHTVEAMQSYIDHLTPEGFILFEVRDVDDLGHASGLRIVNALITAQAMRGDSDPRDNFYVYMFYPSSQRRIRSNNYTMILFKRSAFEPEEVDTLTQWLDDRNAPDEPPRANLLYAPETVHGNDYSRFIRADAEERLAFFPDGSLLTTPTTDNRPFLADANPLFPQARATVRRTAIVVTLLAGLLVLVMWRGRRAGEMISLVPFFVYFACAGLGYLLIEVALIQWLQIFTGLPAFTFVFVLGTLLLFSGIGSYVSRRWSDLMLAALVGLLLLVTVGSAILLPPVIWALQTPILWVNSVIVAGLLAPLAFLMGIPLPFGLRLLKAQFAGEQAALGYGLDGLFSMLGSNLSILVALQAGFDGVFRLGVIAYIGMLVALALIAVRSLRLRGFPSLSRA